MPVSEDGVVTAPVEIATGGLRGMLDSLDVSGVRGWIQVQDEPSRRVRLELFDRDHPFAQAVADRWRNDLEPYRGGDGACGFCIPFPPELFDGDEHRIDARIAGGGPSVLPGAISIVLPARPPSSSPEPVTEQARPARGGAVRLSIVVVFYNMRREAERTLTSLSRAYQRGIEDLEYEVLCIDNGSREPLDPDWVASFGPEFRLVPTSRILPSPCFAINEAASMAKGQRLAVMIDGAHLLSPGAISNAMAAMDEAPGSIVALRQWFVGGDQRWLSACGYSREIEDRLFMKMGWPDDGYLMFNISSPMFESPNHWTDSLIESNCLFLEAEHYRRIGGIDEAFDVPGAGYANLDLFTRAAASVSGRIVALIGEASFHQYHGGTTTNVSDTLKDELVAGYARSYEALRGGPFVGVCSARLHLCGTITTEQALTARQHLFFPGSQSVTDQLRPIALEDFLDEGAQAYARTVYVESGQHLTTKWMGDPVHLAPGDLCNIQEIILQDDPELIVLVDDRTGLARFLADQVRISGRDNTRILHIRPRHEHPMEGVTQIEGGMLDGEVLARLRSERHPDQSRLILFEPAPEDHMPIEALGAYAELTPVGGRLVFLRSLIGQPWIGYSRNWRDNAIKHLLAQGNFTAETHWHDQIITLCPLGYLRRTR